MLKFTPILRFYDCKNLSYLTQDKSPLTRIFRIIAIEIFLYKSILIEYICEHSSRNHSNLQKQIVETCFLKVQRYLKHLFIIKLFFQHSLKCLPLKFWSPCFVKY